MSNNRIGGWLRWLLVAALLYAKCMVFDVLIAHPDSPWWDTSDYIVYAAASVLWALPVLLTKRRYPVFIVLGIADLWILANILYYRSYRLFITWHLLSLTGNMNGFWSSVLPYCSSSLWLIPALSLPALLCFAWEAHRARITELVSVLGLGALLSLSASYCSWRHVRKEFLPDEQLTWKWLNPCDMPDCLSAHVSENERQAARYISHRSILAYPLYMAADAIRTAMQRSQPEALTAEQTQELKQMMGPQSAAHTPQGNLLIVLVESFESWLLRATDADGHPICPALNEYIQTHPVLYVEDVASQIRFGMSGDGQLIVNTGLYPTTEGVACIDYGHHQYPNLAHFYPHSAVVNPCRNVWNQTVVSASYGYQRLVEPQSDSRFEWNDSIVTDRIIETFRTLDGPACVMGITVSGHLPFDSSPDSVAIPDSVPELFRHYMQTARFTDRQLGRLLAWADTAEVMSNSVIAITGDHRIFHAWMSDEVREYGLRSRLPFGTGQAGCPLIVKAPKITSPVTIRQGNQIDIFPTLLEAIGQQDYYWKGMGHSFLGDYSPSDEQEYIRRSNISDKLIRMDYFAEQEQ
ncbi:MAG: sulfatase-like hydrolase/transferase [Paludibacteraceae bacterium]|nr:sulfatase-like hydrolase/transferase [Paludibacteraceae bacterium]